MTGKLDLRQLAVDRSARPPSRPAPRRSWISRYVVPGAVVLGFVAMLGWAARDRYLPRSEVTVVPVVVARAEVQQSDTPLFQAAGWVEPRPSAVLASALADGVIEELLVVEGQQVEAGEPLARLIDADARLELEQAEAELALREAELATAQADLQAARLRHEHPLHLEAALAEADAELAKAETALDQLPHQIESTEAAVEYAERNLAGKRSASTAVAARAVAQAESEHASATARLRELRARQPQLEREAEALRRRREALEEQRRLLIDENRQVADGEARLSAAEAQRDRARVAVRKAELQLERVVVAAPIAGRVMELIASPGTRVSGASVGGESQSSAVVSLYDPAALQVRADVRLEDVPLVQSGQPVEIETASSAEPIRGSVLYATSAANIQKNTLEVKVAIDDPPATIRPEMLVTATFLAPARTEEPSEPSRRRERLLVPRELVESTDGGHRLWVADGEGFARRRTVQLGNAGTDALVEVVAGVTATDKLIVGGRAALEDGERVVITGEDGVLGRRLASAGDAVR